MIINSKQLTVVSPNGSLIPQDTLKVLKDDLVLVLSWYDHNKVPGSENCVFFPLLVSITVKEKQFKNLKV